MIYDTALTLLRNIGKKFHLQITTVTPGEERAQPVDLGLRSFLGLDERYDQLFRDTLVQCADKTIYRLTDEFFCSYLFLILPDTPRHTALIAGPYITFEMDHEQFTSEADRFGVPPWMHKRMEDYYLNIPVIQDATMLLNFFTAFGETIWDEFQIVDMDHDASPPPFRKETGRTITDYVNEKRVYYAADLLRGSSLQVQTIAQYCGIPDVNYFSKIFKRCCGVTPREYRKEGEKTASPV